RKAKEVVLQQNLWTMRRAIDFYWQDKEKPPANLQDLVSGGYLREIPKDPVCADCQWNEIPAPADDSNSAGGIGNVKSTSPGEDLNGKSYADYGDHIVAVGATVREGVSDSETLSLTVAPTATGYIQECDKFPSYPISSTT